ncbi:MAG: ABC transporter ATP-binding protein [Fretibacterium sp.]|nr:ABC transporter ATP-binding protein [Fretibacterium sp.]
MDLVISNISKKFGASHALQDVSAEIKSGEFIAILGPSGCGKTTLLRIIAGFIAPCSGEVLLSGSLLSSPSGGVPIQERNLGMVFQSLALWPHMTVRENIEYPLKSRRNRGMSRKARQEALEGAMTSTGMAQFANRLPGELSGGQRQRVALARAIVERPSLLLMDEPLSALDAELRVNMRREIQDIHRLTGATIVYVTHDQNEALAMADRVMIMRDGRIEQVASPREIYRRPETEFVATFVSKCNLLKGSWDGRNFSIAGVVFEVEPSDLPARRFIERGLFPVRPEDFCMTHGSGCESGGIEGQVANRQYNGRETHYKVRCGSELYTVYVPSGEDVFSLDEWVRLRLKVR